MAVDFIGAQTLDHIFQLDHNFNVSSTYKQLKRTGHARFRRSPPSENKSDETTTSTSSSSAVSSMVGGGLDGSVSNGKQFSSLGIVAPAPTFSSRKPPLPATHRKRCSADRPVASVHRSGCHCCKRRKTGSRRDIKRVPVVGSKITSIPADDYSWKKYGHKKIDGSSYPRVYYKCISGNGCPARKRVELDVHDSKMLIVTYDGEHRHHHAPTPVPISLTGLPVELK